MDLEPNRLRTAHNHVLFVCMNACVYIRTYACVYEYIYIYREREREIEREREREERERERKPEGQRKTDTERERERHIYIYIYTYVCVYVYNIHKIDLDTSLIYMAKYWFQLFKISRTTIRRGLGFKGFRIKADVSGSGRGDYGPGCSTEITRMFAGKA